MLAGTAQAFAQDGAPSTRAVPSGQQMNRFDEQDLRSAQALQATLDTVEEQANVRIAASEENAKRLAGQIEENTALANKAQGTADEAKVSADLANTRINGLDEFDPVKTVTVLFATGSPTLGPKGKAVIDEAAA